MRDKIVSQCSESGFLVKSTTLAVTSFGEASCLQNPLNVDLKEVRALLGLTQSELSQLLGASLVSVVRWERGDCQPSIDTIAKLRHLSGEALAGRSPMLNKVVSTHTFASRGARYAEKDLPLFSGPAAAEIVLTSERMPPLLKRLKTGSIWGEGVTKLVALLADNFSSAPTIPTPSLGGISAGKNTYTYDAHTYHTKVPPQGIAEVAKQYLPEGGLILDPFAGSGMTGVAALTLGYDVILNELSPAASFIADRFTRRIDPKVFASGVRAISECLY